MNSINGAASLPIQWNLSIKDTLNKGHLSNEGTVCSPNDIELCKNLPLNKGHFSIQDRQLGSNGVLYREVLLYGMCMCGLQLATVAPSRSSFLLSQLVQL